MSPEDRKLLEKTYDLAKENHEMLTSIRRSQLIGRFAKVAYWVIIIGLGGVALQALRPYYEGLQDVAGTVKDIGGGATSNYAGLIKQLTN
ncbi:MAG: hypothetical protein AAB391_01830 [Patescibacteria group bacterium]